MERSGSIPMRKWTLFVASVFVLLLYGRARSQGQDMGTRIASTTWEHSDQRPGAYAVRVKGYAELQVDGQPFFVYAAALPYYGVPHDLWASSLDRYRELGINTIELRIPWNWHEPQEGEFDFDGHTAPGRDLRGLLRLIAVKGFKLILRPGPIGGGEWRNAGYPSWLLAKREFDSALTARVTGESPTNVPKGDSTGSSVLGSRELTRVRTLWLSALAREIGAYNGAEKESKPDIARSNPPLCVVMDQPIGLDVESSSPDNAYLVNSRAAWTAGGSDPPCFAGAIRAVTTLDASIPESFPMAGQWRVSDLDANTPDGTESAELVQPPGIEALLRFAEFLEVRPQFPVLMLDLGGADSSEDGPPAKNLPDDLLLTSRSFLAEGARGIDFEPFQQTLIPPGYETTASTTDSAPSAVLGLLGDSLPAAEAVQRNGDLIRRSGNFLASSHPRTILGLLDFRNSLALTHSAGTRSNQMIEAANNSLHQAQRVANLADIASDVSDPIQQPAESLFRDPVLLAVLPPEMRNVPLSDAAQLALLDYVRRGGILVCDPQLPAGEELQKAVPANEMTEAGDGVRSYEFGSGRVVVWDKDSYSWIKPGQQGQPQMEEPQTTEAIRALKALLRGQGVSTPVFRSSQETPTPWFFRELLPDAQTEPFGVIRSDCRPGQDCAEGLLSVSNWSDRRMQNKLQVLMPTTNVRTATPNDYVELPLELSARESLMLPLNTPLCSAANSDKSCTDRVIAAGGELTAFVRDDKVLELTFFAPSKATILLHLEAPPRKVELLGNMPEKFVYQPPEFPHDPPPPPIPESERNLEGVYINETGIFKFEIPRGPAPNYLRTVRLHLPYVPHVTVAPKASKQAKRGYTYSVMSSLRLPIGQGEWLPGDPPMVALDALRNGRLALNIQNLDDAALTLHVDVSGAAIATKTLRLGPKEDGVFSIDLHSGGTKVPDEEGVLHGDVQISSNSEAEHLPLKFVITGGDAAAGYRYDLARSGTPDWILENDRLRIIVAPAAGGRMLALTDKSTPANVTGSLGALRDLVAISGNLASQDLTFNLPYLAQWQDQGDSPAIRMTGQFPAGSPVSGEIQKIISLRGSNTVHVEYEVRLLPAASLGGRESSFPALTTAFSAPAFEGDTLGTQFCWSPPGAIPSAPVVMHCEPFTANGAPIIIPEHISQIQVRTASQPPMTMIWKEGRAVIKPLRHSVQLLLEFPVPTANRPGPYSVDYIVGTMQ
jgi:hypothetical protein